MQLGQLVIGQIQCGKTGGRELGCDLTGLGPIGDLQAHKHMRLG